MHFWQTMEDNDADDEVEEDEENILNGWFDEETGMDWVMNKEDFDDLFGGFEDEELEWELMSNSVGKKSR